MNTTRTSACIFCGRVASIQSVTPSVRLSCSVCGLYEVTTGALGILRNDVKLRAVAFAEIRRQMAAGVECPQINLELINKLKGL